MRQQHKVVALGAMKITAIVIWLVHVYIDLTSKALNNNCIFIVFNQVLDARFQISSLAALIFLAAFLSEVLGLET